MIVARHVTGKIIRLRSYVRYVLIAIFMVTPWLQYNGRQALLFDLGNNKGSFFFPGFIIWPQENHFLLFTLLLLGLSMFLFTALLGRIWCGWTCPQTIFVEFFDEIGRLIFPSKYGKRSATTFHKTVVHAVWILIAMISSYHFVGFFHPIRSMTHDLFSMGFGVLTETVWPYFVIVMGLLFYADIGFFREQFCVYLCPYARFQSVMLDDDSIVIAYDSHRGEPRRKAGHGEHSHTVETGKLDAQGEGDCTNCNMCVLVCPTGIDIREGLQVSCINCGHCIDACTKEMEKFDKKSLVNYESERYATTHEPAKHIRMRTVIYSILMVFILSIFGYFAAIRTPIHFYVRPQPGMGAQNVEGKVMNYYRMYMGNITEDPATYTLEVKSDDPGITNLELRGLKEFKVHANGEKMFDNIMVTAEATPEAKGRLHKLRFIIINRDHPDSRKEKDANFMFPES